MNDDVDKFKFLYELISAEYKDEIERSRKVEEKAMRLFTFLNIIFALLASIVLKYDFWKELKEVNTMIVGFLVFLSILIFLLLIDAWRVLFKSLKNKKVKKLVLEQDNEFEDIVYDDSKGMEFLYWRAYKNCQSAIEYNRNSSNELYHSLDIAQNWIKQAFTLLCVFLFVLFLCYLKRVCV